MGRNLSFESPKDRLLPPNTEDSYRNEVVHCGAVLNLENINSVKSMSIKKIYLERMITHYTCLKFYITKISLMTSNLIGFVCIHHVMIQLLDHSYHNAFLFIRYLQYILLNRFISKYCCIVSLKKIIPFIVRLQKYLSHT